MKASLFFLLALLLNGACKKEPTELDALPAATQDGRHTFGCLVDGKAFLPTPGQAVSITTRQPLEAYVYRTDLLVSGRGSGYVEFALRHALRPGSYPLGDIRTGSYGSYSASGNRYDTNLDHPGTVTITRLDTVAKIAAGTFQFTGSDYRSGNTVTITQGRFDVRLK